MEVIKIIKAEPRHASAIHQLIKEVLAQYGLFHLRPPGVDDDIDDLEGQYFDNNGYFWLYVDKDGQVVGCYSLFRLGQLTCELRKMYLQQTFRGKGFGKQMLDTAIAMAKSKGYNRMQLKTNANLKEAIGLYRKYGFKYDIIRPVELKEDCDIAMV